MLAINLDLHYLTTYLGISTQKIQAYGTSNLEEIVKAEALAGNEAAQQALVKILNDADSLLELFRLGNANNRWQILKELSEYDLQNLLQYLEKEDLLIGLQFFQKEGLLQMIQELPEKEVCQIVFEVFAPKDFIKLIPEDEINKWFESTKVDPNLVFEQLQNFNPEILAQMIYAVTGQFEENQNRAQLLKTIEGFNKEDFLKSVQSLEPRYKYQIILNMTKEKPDLWFEFGSKTLAKPLERLQKPEIIKGMGALKEKTLIKIVDNLPQELLSVVMTQIDPEVFAKVLCQDYQELLKKAVSV